MAGGALLFARYAYPPSALGYCGPDAAGQLLEQVDAGVDDGGLRQLVRGFEGAWPYLELIAGAAGRDPLDRDVVDAYWIGNELLELVGPRLMGISLEARFRARAGRDWAWLVDAVPAGALPHHSFHVFGVYPWLGLLRTGLVEQPLHVLDRCRIRWGRVEAVAVESALVRSRPLVWDGLALSLGPPRVERVRTRAAGHALAGPLRVGDWCSLHWDWVCERLDARRAGALAHWTTRQLAVVNGLHRPGPAAVLA